MKILIRLLMSGKFSEVVAIRLTIIYVFCCCGLVVSALNLQSEVRGIESRSSRETFKTITSTLISNSKFLRLSIKWTETRSDRQWAAPSVHV